MDKAEEWAEEHSGKEASLNRPIREKINATVRYKSYGELTVKDFGSGEDDTLLVRGFFTSDGQDETGDIITKGATVKAIERWRQWGNIRTMHDYPSGRVEAVGERDGLRWNEIVTVPVDENTKKLIRGGVLKAYSVGIIPREYEINEAAVTGDSWVYPLIIHDYDMVEISYVDHPANYSAIITDVSNKNYESKAILFKAFDENGVIEKMDEELDVALPQSDNDGLTVPEPQEVAPVVDKDIESDAVQVDSQDPEGVITADLGKGQDVEPVREYDFESLINKVDGLFSVVEQLSAAVDVISKSVSEILVAVSEVEKAVEEEAVPQEPIEEKVANLVVERVLGAIGVPSARGAVVSVEPSEKRTGSAVVKELLALPVNKRRELMKEMINSLYNEGS